MRNSVLDNKIISNCNFSDKCYYDLGNKKISCQLNAAGSISKFIISGYGAVLKQELFYSDIAINSKSPEVSDLKKVEMYARIQKVNYSLNDCDIQRKVFITDEGFNIYEIISLSNVSNKLIEFNFGWVEDSQYKLKVYSDKQINTREEFEGCFHGNINFLCKQDKEIFYLVYSPDIANVDELKIKENSETAQKLAEDYFTRINQLALHHGDSSGVFVSALNCALSCYKSIEYSDGKTFEGFFAGIDYMSPARTYYRDGYYTAIATLCYDSNLTKNQIIALAKGISKDFSCGSAVDSSGNQWWNNHIDSPMFFVLLVKAYLEHTKDKELLGITVNGKNIADWIKGIVDNLIGKLDKNNLLPREEYNRLDWADNVYRCGYVSYICALLYGTVSYAAKLFANEQYAQKAKSIKTAITEILYNSGNRCYYNYKNSNYIEDNLSLDTVLLVLFNAIDDKQSVVMLNEMQSKLESINNKQQPFGDVGVMCVYPPYKFKNHLVEKSSYDYVYHNGSEWPYLSAAYAIAKRHYGMPYKYALTRWFYYSLEQNWFTPVEYHNALTGRGSLLQGWSGFAVMGFVENSIKYFI